MSRPKLSKNKHKCVCVSIYIYLEFFFFFYFSKTCGALDNPGEKCSFCPIGGAKNKKIS